MNRDDEATALELLAMSKRVSELVHDLEVFTGYFHAIRQKVQNLVPVIEPYIEAWELSALKDLLVPFPTMEAFFNALQAFREIERRGLKH